MRNIFLIFRRDYLGYVKAWGFWLSLAAVPMFMGVGALFAAFAAQSSPVRYYAVIEPGHVYADAINAQFRHDEAEEQDQAEALSDTMQLPAQAGAPGNIKAIRERKFVEVPAPATDLDGLRPYLLGERLTAADLLVQSPYMWFPDGAPKDDKVKAWITRVAARPSYAWATVFEAEQEAAQAKAG